MANSFVHLLNEPIRGSRGRLNASAALETSETPVLVRRLRIPSANLRMIALLLFPGKVHRFGQFNSCLRFQNLSQQQGRTWRAFQVQQQQQVMYCPILSRQIRDSADSSLRPINVVKRGSTAVSPCSAKHVLCCD